VFLVDRQESSACSLPLDIVPFRHVGQVSVLERALVARPDQPTDIVEEPRREPASLVLGRRLDRRLGVDSGDCTFT